MNEIFMQQAIDLALKSVNQYDGGPFGAIIVKNNKIIGQGYNAVTKSCDPTAHAEIQAIRDACQHENEFHLTDCQLYTTCEPCPMCMSAIYWSHIGQVFYAASGPDARQAGFDDVMIKDELLKPYADRKINITQIMRHQAQDIFQNWLAKEDKIAY